MNGIKSLALFYVKAFQDLLTEEIKHLERERERKGERVRVLTYLQFARGF